jgi:acyl-CoA hydrolase
MRGNMKGISDLVKDLFSNLDSFTKDKTLELLQSVQDFVVNNNMVNEEQLDLELAHKIQRSRKKKNINFVHGPDYKHIYTRIVFPEDLNFYQTLFGGKMLAWLDTSGVLACNEEGYEAPVTVAMKDTNFLSSPGAGDIIKFYYQVLQKKRTYMWVQVVGYNMTKKMPIIDSEMRFMEGKKK